MKTWKCPRCGKPTDKDYQFCRHCLFNVTAYYLGTGPAIKTGIPWDVRINPDDNRFEQQSKTEHIIAEKKKWTSTSSKLARWEKGRKKRLFERRDYFRSHPKEVDDFSGV